MGRLDRFGAQALTRFAACALGAWGSSAVVAQMLSIPPRTRADDGELSRPLGREALEGWTLEEKVGQLLMVGYRSPEQLANYRPGGIVLFSWNIEDPEQTKRMVDELKQMAEQRLKAPLFIATDQEGGKVLRIRRGMTPFPDAAAIGALGDPWMAFRVGKSMGLELASLGLNMNFAPVLDVGNAKSFLANRIWGEADAEAGASTIGFIQGLQASRVLAVAKHFPGHGGTQMDSHLGLPRVMKPYEAILREDIAPFKRAIENGVQAVMTAHVEMPAVDRGPASLSKKFLTDILREKLGFEGLVITDDLEMDGVAAEAGGHGREDLAMRALQAGTDMILVVWSKKRQDAIFARLMRAVRSGEVSEEWLESKVLRILNVKRRYAGLGTDGDENPYWRENLRRPESLELASEVTLKAIRWLAGSEKDLSAKFGARWGEPWRVFVPDNTVEKTWKGFRPGDELVYLPRKPRPAQSASTERSLNEAIQQDKPVVVVTPPRAEFSEQLFKIIQQAMAKRTTDTARSGPVLWIHQGLRPLDIQWRPETIKIGLVSLHSTSAMSLEAVKDTLRSGAPSKTRF